MMASGEKKIQLWGMIVFPKYSSDITVAAIYYCCYYIIRTFFRLVRDGNGWYVKKTI